MIFLQALHRLVVNSVIVDPEVTVPVGATLPSALHSVKSASGACTLWLTRKFSTRLRRALACVSRHSTSPTWQGHSMLGAKTQDSDRLHLVFLELPYLDGLGISKAPFRIWAEDIFRPPKLSGNALNVNFLKDRQAAVSTRDLCLSDRFRTPRNLRR